MKCKCCERCRGSGDKAEAEDEVITYSEKSPLKHFGIDKHFSELVREKGKMHPAEVSDKKLDKTNINNNNTGDCGGTCEGRSSSKSTSEVSGDPLLASESYLTTGLSKSIFSSGSSTQDVDMVGHETTGGLGLGSGQGQNPSVACGASPEEHDDRGLDGHEWQNEASMQMADNEAMPATGRAGIKAQHKGHSTSNSERDAEGRYWHEDRSSDKSSILSINFCEIAPSAQSLSSVYVYDNSRDHSVDNTTSYSSYTKIFDFGAPVSCQLNSNDNTSTHSQKGSEVTGKDEDHDVPENEGDVSGWYFGSGRKNSFLLEFTSTSGSSFEDLSSELVPVPSLPRRTLGQESHRSGTLSLESNRSGTLSQESHNSGILSLESHRSDNFRLGQTTLIRETSVDDGICYESTVGLQSLDSSSNKQGVSSPDDCCGKGDKAIFEMSSRRASNLPKISEVEMIDLCSSDKLLTTETQSGRAVISCSENERPEMDEDCSVAITTTVTRTTSSYSTSVGTVGSESFSNISSGAFAESCSTQHSAVYQIMDPHDTIDDEDEDENASVSGETTTTASHSGTDFPFEFETQSNSDAQTGVASPDHSDGNVSFKIMKRVTPEKESPFEVFRNERLAMRFFVAHAGDGRQSSTTGSSLSKFDEKETFENEKFLISSSEWQSSGTHVSSKVVIQSEKDDSDSTLDEEIEDSISSSFFLPCNPNEFMQEDQTRWIESRNSEFSGQLSAGDATYITDSSIGIDCDSKDKSCFSLSVPESTDVSVLGDVHSQVKGDCEVSAMYPDPMGSLEDSETARSFLGEDLSTVRNLVQDMSNGLNKATNSKVTEFTDLKQQISPVQDSINVFAETLALTKTVVLELRTPSENLANDTATCSPQQQSKCTASQENTEDFMVTMRDAPKGKSATCSFIELDSEIVAPKAREIIESDLHTDAAAQNGEVSHICDVNVVRPRRSSLIVNDVAEVENLEPYSSALNINAGDCNLALIRTPESFCLGLPLKQSCSGIEYTQDLNEKEPETRKLLASSGSAADIVVACDDVLSSDSEESEVFNIKDAKIHRSSVCSGNTVCETLDLTEDEGGSCEEMLLQSLNLSGEGPRVINVPSSNSNTNCSSGDSVSNTICSFNVSVAPFASVAGELCTLGVIKKPKHREVVIWRNAEFTNANEVGDDSFEQAESKASFRTENLSNNEVVQSSASLAILEEPQKLETTVAAGISTYKEQFVRVFDRFNATGEIHEVVAIDQNNSFHEEMPLRLPEDLGDQESDCSSSTGRGLHQRAALTFRISPVEAPSSLSCGVMSFHLSSSYQDDRLMPSSDEHSCEIFYDVRDFQALRQTIPISSSWSSCSKDVDKILYVEASEVQDPKIESTTGEVLVAETCIVLTSVLKNRSELVANEVNLPFASGEEFESVSYADVEIVNALKAQMKKTEHDEFHPSETRISRKKSIYTSNIKPLFLGASDIYTLSEGSLYDVVLVSSNEGVFSETIRTSDFAQTWQNSMQNSFLSVWEKWAAELEFYEIHERTDIQGIDSIIQFSTLTWQYDSENDRGTKIESLENFEPQLMGSPRRKLKSSLPKNNFVKLIHTKSSVFSQIDEAEEIKCFRLRTPRLGTFGYFMAAPPSDDFDDLVIRIFGLFADPRINDDLPEAVLTSLNEPKIQRTSGAIQSYISCMENLYLFRNLCPTCYVHGLQTTALENITEEHSSDLSCKSKTVSVGLHPRLDDDSLSSFDGVECSMPSISISASISSISDRLAGTGVSFDQSSHLLKLEKSENDFHGVLDSEFTLTYSTQDLLQFDFCPQSVEEIASSCKPTVLGPLVKALAVSRDANVEPIAMDASFQETWPGIFRRKSSSPLSESISKDVAGIINVAAVRYGSSPCSELKVSLAPTELESSSEKKGKSFISKIHDYCSEQLSIIDVQRDFGCSSIVDIDETCLSCYSLDQVELSPHGESVVSSCNTSMESCCTVVLKGEQNDSPTFKDYINQSRASMDPQFCDDILELGISPMSGDERTIDSIPTPVCGVSVISSRCDSPSPKICERSSSVVVSRLRSCVLTNVFLGNKVEDFIATTCGQITTNMVCEAEQLNLTDDSKATKSDPFELCEPDVAGDQAFSNCAHFISQPKRLLVENNFSFNVAKGISRQCSLYPVTIDNDAGPNCLEEQSYSMETPSRSKIIPTCEVITTRCDSSTEKTQLGENSTDSSFVAMSTGVNFFVTKSFLRRSYSPDCLENLCELDRKLDFASVPKEEAYMSCELGQAKSNYITSQTGWNEPRNSAKIDLPLRKLSINTEKELAMQDIEVGATDTVQIPKTVRVQNGCVSSNNSIGFIDTPRYSESSRLGALSVNGDHPNYLDRSFDISDMDVVAELDVSLLKTTILPSMDSFPTSEDSCSFVGALLDEHGVKENDVMFLSPMPSTTAFPSVDMSCLLPRTLSPDVYTSHTSETNYDCKMIPNGNMTTETRSNNPALYGSENIDLCTGSSKSNGHKSLECNPQKANNRDKNAFSIEGTPWPECSPEHEICSCVSADMDRNTAPSSTLIHKCSFSEKEDSTNLSSLKETKKSVKAEKENAVKNETEHGVKMGVIYEKAKLLSRVLIYYPNKERRKTGSLTDTSSEPEKQFSEIPTLFDPGKFDSKDSKNTNESHNFNSYYTAREHQSPPSPACRSFTVWDNHSGRAFGDSIGVACQQFIVATAVQQDQESFIFDTTSRNLMSENGTNMNAVSTEQINDDTFLSANEYLQRSSQSNSGSVGGGRKRRIIIDKYHDETINFKTAKKNKNSNFTSNLPGELLVKQDASKDDSGTQMVCANTNFQEEERESDWIFSPTFTSDESSSERKKPHSPFKRTVSVVRKETTVESNQTNSNFVHTQSQSLQSDAESSHEVQSDFDSRLKIQSTSESGQRVVQPGQNDNFNADFDQNVQSDAEPEFHSLETEIQVPKTDYETLSIADTVSVNGEKGGTTQPGPTVTFAEEPITSPMSEEFQVNDHEEVPPSQDMHFPVSSLDNNFIVEVPGSAVSDFVFPDTVDSLNIFGDFDGNGDGLEDGFPCCDCEHCHCYYTESERFNAPSQRYSSSTNSFCSDPNCSGRYTRNSTSSYCSNPECQGDVLNPIRYPTSQHGSYSFSQSSTPEMACWYVEEDTSDAADSFRESVLSGPPVASNSENFVVTVEDVDNPHDVRRQEFPVVQEPLNQPKVGKTRRLHIHRTKQVYETYMESGNKEVNVSQAQNDYWIQQPTSGRLRKNIQSDETTAPVVPVSVEDASAQYQTFSRFNIFRWCK